MLLALAQNANLHPINNFFDPEVGGKWEKMLPISNYARVLRYSLLHLEWLITTREWIIPEDLDLSRWRELAFSYYAEASDAGQ